MFIPSLRTKARRTTANVVTLVLEAATKRTDVAGLDARECARYSGKTGGHRQADPSRAVLIDGFLTRQLFVTPRSIWMKMAIAC